MFARVQYINLSSFYWIEAHAQGKLMHNLRYLIISHAAQQCNQYCLLVAYSSFGTHTGGHMTRVWIILSHFHEVVQMPSSCKLCTRTDKICHNIIRGLK